MLLPSMIFGFLLITVLGFSNALAFQFRPNHFKFIVDLARPFKDE
jgi:hypothetical protein